MSGPGGPSSTAPLPGHGASRVVEATAPCRVDLAGAALDVWPVYLFHPGAVAVSVAIDRRVYCRVENGVDGVTLESKDTPEKACGRTVGEVRAEGTLALAARVLRALGVETGIKVAVQSRVPRETGLGVSAALAVALIAAVARTIGQELEERRLLGLARDIEAGLEGAPTGMRDPLLALHGGAVAVHLEPGETRGERLATDPARIEESLFLVDGGSTSLSATGGWDVLKAQIEGEARTREALAAIGEAARGVRAALVEGRYGDVAALIAEEAAARTRLGPEVKTPEVERILGVVAQAGGAARTCGGGRIVAVWAPPGERGPGRREAVEAALKASGARVFPARLDLRGLAVEGP